jgi:hypothetical protein
MRETKLTRYGVLTFLGLLLLAFAGLVWGHRSSLADGHSYGYQLRGRFISAETAYDVSTVHDAGGGNIGSPVFFATTSVMQADGHGNVSGESDGFYGGTPPPGVNLGPSWFKGVYAIDTNGRVTITACSTTTPGFFADTTPCVTDGTVEYKTWVGYLGGSTLTTVDQINNSDSSMGGCCAATGYLVHARTWTMSTFDDWAGDWRGLDSAKTLSGSATSTPQPLVKAPGVTK